jgi:hypothetical protein
LAVVLRSLFRLALGMWFYKERIWQAL